MISCKHCVFRSRKSSSGEVAYIPVCCCEERRELPYTEVLRGNKVYAEPTFETPEWCPVNKDVNQ